MFVTLLVIQQDLLYNTNVNTYLNNINELNCNIPEHNQKPIESICSKPNCPNKLCCISCVSRIHNACANCGYPNLAILDICSTNYKILEGWPRKDSFKRELSGNNNEDLLKIFEAIKCDIQNVIDTSFSKIKQLILNQDMIRSEIQEAYHPRNVAELMESFKLGQKTQLEVNQNLTTIFSDLEAFESTFSRHISSPRSCLPDKIAAVLTKTLEEVSDLVKRTMNLRNSKLFHNLDKVFRGGSCKACKSLCFLKCTRCNVVLCEQCSKDTLSLNLKRQSNFYCC